MTPVPVAAEKNTKNAAEQTCNLMDTILRKVDPQQPDAAVIRQAADILRAGGLVAFPTLKPAAAFIWRRADLPIIR